MACGLIQDGGRPGCQPCSRKRAGKLARCLQPLPLRPPAPPLRDSALLLTPSHALTDAPCRFLLIAERHNLEVREMRSLGCDERNARIALFRVEDDSENLNPL